MKITVNIVILLSFFGHILLTTQSDIPGEDNRNITIINGTATNSTIKQVANKPIIIHTQIQYYDEPTLRDYQECYENLQKCKSVCEGVEKPLECVKQCPICPLLIKEKIVVQGVNDTNYTPQGPPPVNTTNIIRLTNEIHNIIESQRGNITYNNDNIVNVFQNVSRVGGKFGLGYNNTDPCCIILSLTKSCKTRTASNSAHCHRKKHRVCGRKCTSRVMQAKRITVCEKGTSNDEYEEYEDYNDENCYEIVKYVPYHSQKRRRYRPRSKCASIPSWPYVKCGYNNAHYNRQSICRRCLSITYQYVLHRGIPAQCAKCFMMHVNPNLYEIYPMWRPDFMSHNNDYEDGLNLETNDWRHDKTLCRLPNGKISENCNEHDNNINESPLSTTNPLSAWDDVMPEAQEEYLQSTIHTDDDDDEYYDENYEQINRKRRHTFKPSKYSRRHKLP